MDFASTRIAHYDAVRGHSVIQHIWRYRSIDCRKVRLIMNIEELEAAVAHLPPSDLARFSQWFAEFTADQWDQKIESDILAGRFDAAGKRADEDFEAGRCTPL